MTWTKNQLIEPCPTHLRVLFKGNVIVTKEEISKDVILSNFLKRRKSSVPQSQQSGNTNRSGKKENLWHKNEKGQEY